MQEGNQDSPAWPPAPTIPLTNLHPIPKPRYLTGVKGLDIVLGIIIGLTFQWFAVYGVSTGLYYLINFCYHIPKPTNGWHLVVASVIALGALLLMGSRLRSFYETFTKSLVWSGLFFGSLLLWLSYEMATDTGPNILPR